jgi:hypothetical protein
MALMERSKSAVEEFNEMTGDTYVNEDLFEGFTKRLFKRSDFDLLRDGRKIESEKNPGLQFWHKRSGHSFWVECKFRNDYYNDKLDWCRPDHFECYKQFQEDVWPEKIYIVIGFGGRPLKPSFMFCMSLDEMENCCIYPNVLEKYERDPTQPFDYQGGRLV